MVQRHLPAQFTKPFPRPGGDEQARLRFGRREFATAEDWQDVAWSERPVRKKRVCDLLPPDDPDLETFPKEHRYDEFQGKVVLRKLGSLIGFLRTVRPIAVLSCRFTQRQDIPAG